MPNKNNSKLLKTLVGFNRRGSLDLPNNQDEWNNGLGDTKLPPANTPRMMQTIE